MITHYYFLATKMKNNYFLVILYHTSMLLLISRCQLLFMYAHAEKCHSSAKKITQFKFSSFQENILCKDNRYLLKKKKIN